MSVIIGKIKDQWTKAVLDNLPADFKKKKVLFLVNPSSQIIFTAPAKLLFYKVFWTAGRKPIGKIAGLVLRLLSAFCQCIIASTQGAESNYLKQGIKSGRIRLLYPPAAAASNFYSGASRELVIGCDAALSLDNGLGSVLKAQSLAQDILGNLKLVIGGVTPEKAKIEWIADNLQIGKHAQISPTKQTDWVKRIDIYILPAAEPELPLSLHTALACGKAIISVDAQAAREFIAANKNGVLLQQTSSEMISQAIINLGRNQLWRRMMSENNLALAARIFSREKFDEIADQIFA